MRAASRSPLTSGFQDAAAHMATHYKTDLGDLTIYFFKPKAIVLSTAAVLGVVFYMLIILICNVSTQTLFVGPARNAATQIYALAV